MNETSASMKHEPLPPDFEEIGKIEDLSIVVTKLEMEREGLSYMNVAHMSFYDRLTLGMHVARVEARLLKARNELKAAQERYAVPQKGVEECKHLHTSPGAGYNRWCDDCGGMLPESVP